MGKKYEKKEDYLVNARQQLDLGVSDLNVQAITDRLIRYLQKNPKKCGVLCESALILVQSLPERKRRLLDEDKVDISGEILL